MTRLKSYVFCAYLFLSLSDAAKILSFYPMPSISHQVVFRPLTLELVKRGHEVTVITPDPIFPKGKTPANLTEIDVHDFSYELWRNVLKKLNNKMEKNQFVMIMKELASLVEKQLTTDAVQKILQDKTKKFDLVIVEAMIEPALGLAYKYKTPVIQFSSLASVTTTMKTFGAASHPLLFPSLLHRRVFNLTMWEKINALYDEYEYEQMLGETDDHGLKVMKRVFGPDVPELPKLRSNVDVLFLNVYPMWDFNRPVPPNVVYLGGMHQKPAQNLPKDLQTYLDSSKNGVIYISFGTNVDPGLFSPEKIKTLVNAFSKLPYDILWKWNQDELPGRTTNIKISKWLPQSDLLRHPKIKFFVTQCGLQSTDEAITAGVPLLGMPVLGDQKFNAEQYTFHRIGVVVDIDTVTEGVLDKAISQLLQDESYRHNIIRLRELVQDQPQTPLERAVWWTEYTIRHSGARHLRAPSAGLSIAQYYELELVSYVLIALVVALALILSVVRLVNIKISEIRCKLKKS